MSKASQEANSALAEMRSASNDARRQRSGEEKKSMTELKRLTDDLSERMHKVIDLTAPRASGDDDKTHACVEAFHALPFTSKLRLLADDRVAVSIFFVSFATGMTLMLG